MEAGHVFADNIKFEINGTAFCNRLNVSMFEGVWDNGDIEFGSFDIENGKADAIEADGTFFDDQVAEFFGEFETVFPTPVLIGALEAGSGGVDVALDDVAIEAAIYYHTSFEVDEVAG